MIIVERGKGNIGGGGLVVNALGLFVEPAKLFPNNIFAARRDGNTRTQAGYFNIGVWRNDVQYIDYNKDNRGKTRY